MPKYLEVWKDPATVTQLITLWNLRDAAGGCLSTYEIARRMKLTQNQVVKKAARLGLARRENPITRLAASTPAVVPERAWAAAAVTLPPLANSADVPEERDAASASPLPVRRSRSCQWPIGNPKSAEFRMCDTESEAGQSYCIDHCRQAFDRASTARFDRIITKRLGSGT